MSTRSWRPSFHRRIRHRYQPLIEDLAKLKSGDVVLRARSPRGGLERQITLRCVTEPDEAQAALLHGLGLTLPRRLRRLDNLIQM